MPGPRPAAAWICPVFLPRLRPHEQLESESLLSLMRTPQSDLDRSVIITQGPNNHAIHSQHWRYIRYQDGSEELYDHLKDPQDFANLAADPEYAHIIIKSHLAKLPSTNVPVKGKRRPRKKK